MKMIRIYEQPLKWRRIEKPVSSIISELEEKGAASIILARRLPVSCTMNFKFELIQTYVFR